MKKARFIRNFESILCFAFAGTLISTFVVGAVIFYGGRALNDGSSLGINFDTPFDSLKFGAMISATDPVATLSVLSSMRPMRDPDLYSLIFGESVLNDAIAVVLFTVFDQFGSRTIDDVGIADLAEAILAIGETVILLTLSLHPY